MMFKKKKKAIEYDVVEQLSATEEYRGYFCQTELCRTMFAPKQLTRNHKEDRECL